ncbi:hypothetical protein EMGBS15_05930 [Filimonas sp.]|nr:hypothetical protein EMGBS15_05930 [Filimonas sp.]
MVSIVLMLTAATLIKHGMFMDAMLYTSVSHNLSQGIGTFWFPFFDEYNIINLTSFHEQPPLVFGIQSLFFRVLGDGMYVERFYTFFTLCVTVWLIVTLWGEVTKDNQTLRPYAWLACLIWITIPVCFWSYSNNMHENTMGIFTLSSVLLSYKALQSHSSKVFLYILAGLFVCLAVLSKGFPGFFPITVPFLYWLFVRKKSFPQIALYSFILLVMLLMVGIGLYFYPDSKESLSIYLFKRAFARINEAHTVNSRFFILWRLLSELIPAFMLTAVVFTIAKWKGISTEFSTQKRQAFFFLSIGISGSLPLMLTLVQNGFYFVPSLPFFGIGFALLLSPVVDNLLKKINPARYHLYFGTTLLLLAGSLVFTYLQKDKFSRDKDLLHDIDLISSVVPKNTRMHCTHSAYQNWELNCYLVRTYNSSVIDIELDDKKRDFFVSEIDLPNPDPSLYDEIKLATFTFKLYKRKG